MFISEVIKQANVIQSSALYKHDIPPSVRQKFPFFSGWLCPKPHTATITSTQECSFGKGRGFSERSIPIGYDRRHSACAKLTSLLFIFYILLRYVL